MKPQPILWLGGVLLIALVWAPLQAQTVYRLVDDTGRVTFTDNAQSGGREVTLEPLQRIASAAPQKPPLKASPGAPFMPYDRFTIARPESVMRLFSEPFAVEINLRPQLREDHQIRLLVDGRVSQSALHGQAFWVPALATGEHQLQAEL
ncbi:MAG: DUF4124 domain-containing protein, partial [Halomonadaceae bacterium]